MVDIRKNMVYTHNAALSVVRLTRVLPYKIARVQHAVSRTFVIAILVAFLLIFFGKETCCVACVFFFLVSLLRLSNSLSD